MEKGRRSSMRLFIFPESLRVRRVTQSVVGIDHQQEVKRNSNPSLSLENPRTPDQGREGANP